MAAYSAVACFRQILHQLLDSDQLPPHISKPQIEFLHEKVSSLQSSLDKTAVVPKNWGKHSNELQIRIRDAVYAAQDEIDYSIIGKGHLSPGKPDEVSFDKIAASIDLIAKEAEDTAEAIRNDPQAQHLLSEKPPPPPAKSKPDSKDKAKGLEEDLKAVKDLVLSSEDLQRLVIPIAGPAGIGKTTLARRIYEDGETKARFSVRAWVTVSRKDTFNKIFTQLLSCVGSEDAQGDDEEKLLSLIHHQLYNRRYLIVIDNVYDAKVWDRVTQALPDTGNGSRVLVTTRNPKIGRSIQEYGYVHMMEPLQSISSEKDKIVIVGQDEDFKAVTDLVLSSDDKQRLVIPITGLPGLGKTTLARSIYESREVQSTFNIRSWVTVSQDFSFGEIYSNLLSSMESKNYEAGYYATQGDEETLFNRLHQELYNLKYLIVVDDVWDIRAWEKLSLALPDWENGSRILVTTRIPNLAESIQRDGYTHTMRPLGMEESWKLLCHKVFDEVEGEKDITKACPPDLKEIGRSIAHKCKGLPLSITVIGGILLQERMNVEYWKRIEEDVGGAAAQGQDSYMDILSLSYTQLPAKLKACFLYMGAFPEDSEIRVSKLIKLWVAEGFLTSPRDPNVEHVAQTMLEDLVGRNLIFVLEKSSDGRIKFCGVHDSLRELAERECGKEKFFHSRKKYSQLMKADLIIQRRVSVHINLLMSLGEVHETTKSIKYARTLLYLGPHHHHPLPFCLTFDLLRVLDAFTVYFIRFPEEFLRLVHLTYLSLTYNHELPSKISQLRKLQTLMVRREPKLIFVGASFLPDEIWEMSELRHLWFTESDFPALPPSPPQIALLLNLQTLTNVNAAFFTDEILDNMPNLTKLAMWIEAPDKLDFNVAKMHRLEHFKFVVLNPIPGKGIEVEAEHFFPRTLKRLNLRGCGLPWEYMEYVAGNLPDLEVLKLKELAFYGYRWRLDYNLKKLKYLLMEYLNFQTWEAEYSNYPSLEKLIIRHCYELEEIPEDLGFISSLELLELVDCSRDAVRSANAIMLEQEEGYDNLNLHVRIFSSWE